MGVLGDVSKGIMIFAVGFWVYLILQFIVTNQIVFAVLFLAGLIIPIAYVVLEYQNIFKQFQCRKCKHHFEVSHLKLLFTLKFQGNDPVPTGTAAYQLTCPNCKDKEWLVPQ